VNSAAGEVFGTLIVTLEGASPFSLYHL